MSDQLSFTVPVLNYDSGAAIEARKMIEIKIKIESFNRKKEKHEQKNINNQAGRKQNANKKS